MARFRNIQIGGLRVQHLTAIGFSTLVNLMASLSVEFAEACQGWFIVEVVRALKSGMSDSSG